MKPTRGQIASAFGVPAAAILDTKQCGKYPPLQWARAAFVGLQYVQNPERPMYLIARENGLGVATPYNWLAAHERYMVTHPKYARIFQSLLAVSEVA
jgi:hypothetical protein